MSWESDPYVASWPEMHPFWAAAAQGRFLMPRCVECGKFHWHPRAVCPFCRSSALEWVPSAGAGTIFSYSIARTASPPHVIAFVQSQEGPVILTRIIDCDPEEIRIDLPVKVRLVAVPEGRTMPFFAPAVQ